MSLPARRLPYYHDWYHYLITPSRMIDPAHHAQATSSILDWNHSHDGQDTDKWRYPPEMSDESIEALFADIKDWQITHGTQLKVIGTDDGSSVLSQSVGATLFPTLFPEELFEEALALQATFNKLYAAVAEDEQWLSGVLKDLIDVDPLANTLWTIYKEVKQAGCIQDMTLGIFRSDYMLHTSNQDDQLSIGLKQVECNTIACAGGVHSNKTSDMHRHLLRTGIFHSDIPSLHLDPSSLPVNLTLNTITTGLISAHQEYGAARYCTAKETCIIMVVQPNNFNIADERPIEYALWDASIPCFRVIFGREVVSYTSVAPSGELIYQPPYRQTPLEVSVVYFRSGFEPHEYDDLGQTARFQLEKSRAIKCPNILGHLATFKKVQQALTMPGVLERFLSADEARRVEKTFVRIWPMNESSAGQEARRLALDRNTARDYILKPSLEGGGNNIYGEDIVDFLKNTPEENWHTFILMEKITPPLLMNAMLSSRGFYQGPVVSELGVFGACLWTRAGGKAVIVNEMSPCWSFKTKSAEVNEMSVVKGYGCFDSPALVDCKSFQAHIKAADRLR